MEHRVTGKQQNSKMCFLCGLKNSFGLKAAFYELESNELVCIFTPSNEHQSYPGRLHGGITTAVLDETIGRAIMMISKEEVWGVTIEFTTRFKKQIPLNQELRVVGRITNETSRTFEGTGELLLPGGEVAATGFGKYLRMPLDKISDFDPQAQEWKITTKETDPEIISF
ncbi:MAG: PaaI family thioesterase [Ignavibacteriae bacterium]|nr:MAG: PaaI family thioesterase [Ignavibacteriota bacterium]